MPALNQLKIQSSFKRVKDVYATTTNPDKLKMGYWLKPTQQRLTMCSVRTFMIRALCTPYALLIMCRTAQPNIYSHVFVQQDLDMCGRRGLGVALAEPGDREDVVGAARSEAARGGHDAADGGLA